MNNINKWLTLTANLGVILGIVFLAIELSQNNELLEAQARAEQLGSRNSYQERMLDGVDLAAIAYKADQGENLNLEEEYYWFNFAIYNYIQWEWQYREYTAGILPREDLPIGGWRAVSRATDGQTMPIWIDAWENYSTGARAGGYVEFLNENVFTQ